MRAFLIYMMTHPGKKLLFMGCENGQFTEWNYETEVEWFLLDYEQHKKLHTFVRDLNRLYLAHSELWEADDSWDGFEWVEVDNADESIIAIRRKNRAGDALLTVINFTPVERPGHILRVPAHTSYSMLLDSSDEKVRRLQKDDRRAPRKEAEGRFLDHQPRSAGARRSHSERKKSSQKAKNTKQ